MSTPWNAVRRNAAFLLSFSNLPQRDGWLLATVAHSATFFLSKLGSTLAHVPGRPFVLQLNAEPAGSTICQTGEGVRFMAEDFGFRAPAQHRPCSEARQ